LFGTLVHGKTPQCLSGAWKYVTKTKYKHFKNVKYVFPWYFFLFTGGPPTAEGIFFKNNL
jgi:hypothetical protein